MDARSSRRLLILLMFSAVTCACDDREIESEERFNGWIGPGCDYEIIEEYFGDGKDIVFRDDCSIREGPGTEYDPMGWIIVEQVYDYHGKERSSKRRYWINIAWADATEITENREWFDKVDRKARIHSVFVWLTGVSLSVLVAIVAAMIYRNRSRLRYDRRLSVNEDFRVAFEEYLRLLDIPLNRPVPWSLVDRKSREKMEHNNPERYPPELREQAQKNYDEVKHAREVLAKYFGIDNDPA